MTVAGTLGVEEEFHLIDAGSRKLSARAPQLLARLPARSYSAELQRTTVETNSGIARTLDDLRQDILGLRRGLATVAADAGLAIAAAGTAPRSEFADFELTANGRFGRMQEQYRLLVDEQLICGAHIHVGVDDRDLAVEIAQRVQRHLPTLLALSASSPYWNGHDTGYASIRTIIWQRWPTTGATGPLASAAEYDQLVADLIRTGVIADEKMAYFDVRPSSHAPTLELRVCDACPVVDDAVLLAGLFRALVLATARDVEAGVPFTPVAPPLHRAAIWQAARGGLSGNLLSLDAHPRPVPAAAAVRGMIAGLRPQLEELGDWDEVQRLAETLLVRGNSADRQRAGFAERGDLDDVVDLVVAETQGPAEGIVPEVPALRTYASRAGDEAVGPGARPRPQYRRIVDFYRRLKPAAIEERQELRDRLAAEAELSFTVDGQTRGFHVDLVPRLVNSYQWSELRAGLEQRARAIEAFLQDAYGEGRIFRDGVVTAAEIKDGPGWRPEALRLPPTAVRAPVMGFDVVRNEFGGWRVLEDNVRTPSGMAFAIAAREIMDGAAAELVRPPRLLDPRAALPALRRTLAAHAPGGTIVLLSLGGDSSAWYEHRRLAAGAGMLLATPDDVTVADGRVVHLPTGAPIDALYLRLDGELADLRSVAHPELGRAILDVAAEGRVVLANAPGNGIADDKAVYCLVPQLISYYLGERPLIESVPTYRPGDEAERRIVLERVGELVTKPVDGLGGHGVLIGPTATATEVAERRAQIAREPDRWVAQEVVTLSSHPTFAGTVLEPRHIDLRAFVFVRGTGPDDVELADLGLTRVAAAGSMIVNSSQGGGAKDTWILGPED
ncbi:carboxylate--amine ligase/circularly permuted type 2 ATP-grasp protein [Microbacterium album]|uniref:Putative glutamate--cysteine ligase 2 n=1 Tax=Microbacterium album TaxID=2053191 RepID=A0A917MMP1_9MICO|nr:carboxylate--amine ligase/circularly permuted type 2 ATP-grasp protein [Microbacterium album]GGH45599.1 hypothetical protein GCM10010921_21100 [Microbacterium album]